MLPRDGGNVGMQDLCIVCFVFCADTSLKRQPDTLDGFFPFRGYFREGVRGIGWRPAHPGMIHGREYPFLQLRIGEDFVCKRGE